MPLKLPRLPYEQKPYTPQIVTFGGVNYSQNHKDGELEDCRNLSTREYPCLSQRPGRKTVEGYENVTAVYDYFGKLIVCGGGKLYMDGKEICQVSDGPKQFAVVNTQLVVWPDGIVVSLTEERVLQDCEPVVTANDASTVYDGSSITAPVYIPVAIGGDQQYSWNNGAEYTVYTYGTDREKLLACWDGAAWDMEKLEELEKLTPISRTHGEFIITDSNGYFVTGTSAAAPNKSYHDPTGLYALANVQYLSIAATCSATVTAVRYRAGLENTMFYKHFAVRDWADVSGGPYGLVGTEHAQVETVDALNNTLTFSGADVLRRPGLYCKKEMGRYAAGESVYLYYTYSYNGVITEYFLRVTPGEQLPEGCIAFCDKGDTAEYWSGGSIGSGAVYGHYIKQVRFWHEEKREIFGPYNVENIAQYQMPEEYMVMEMFPKVYALTIVRSMPKLDYICASDNRLWGISNEDKTIWGSELGMPFSFYKYEGLSTDSYAVPVGSDGDFTGCIGYGGNVLFWKEDKLHKLLGTAPENYQLYEYTVRGLMDGCHKSQVIINETLFFKSRDGVCAYTGSVPSLISENFGVRRFRDAAAGTDGEKYYVSMQDTQTGAWGLWVYDPATGLWLQEGAERVLDFANLNGTLYLLMDGGRVLMAGQTDSGEEIEWEATFCEMTEQYHERKCYSRLLLRVDMEQGAFCRGEISTDGGPFREVGILHGARNKTGEMLVQPTNCDRFQVRISGRGRCRLKSLIREFTFGGER